MRFSIRLVLTPAILIALVKISLATELAADRPNIVLIVADDLGYNDLSCYRGEQGLDLDRPPTAQTPHLDQLASEGTRLTDFYSGAAVCSPSRAALLTGRNATRVGIYNWIPEDSPMHLRDEEITMAELLRESRYRTGHFGKWHLTADAETQPLPMDQGFDHAFYTYNNANPSHRNPVNFHRNGEAVGELDGYSCHLVVDEAIEWMESVDTQAGPFLLNVWFNEPHDNVAAPEELAQRHPYRGEYYGCIENMDLAVGRLMAYLEEKGVGDDTLVLFTSDNGSQVRESNAPLRGDKCFNFEGGIRVPFIARWPGKIKAGKVDGAIGSFVDILPTLAILTGTALPEGRTLDGVDLGPSLFRGEEIRREKPVFFFRYFHEPIAMLRNGRYVLLGFEEPIPYQTNYDVREMAKLKPAPGEPIWSAWGYQPSHQEYLEQCVPEHFELFDIEKDIKQSRDIAADHPQIVERMKAQMLELRKEMISEGGDWFSKE